MGRGDHQRANLSLRALSRGDGGENLNVALIVSKPSFLTCLEIPSGAIHVETHARTAPLFSLLSRP
jgi:hypothetical protein